MRALNVLTTLCLVYSAAVAKEAPLHLENYLSTLKQREFNYDYQKNRSDSLKMRDSWIQPIQLSYTYSKSNPYGNVQSSKVAAISINQPIFKSGGIYYAIKYAEASQKYSEYSIDVQKRKLITQAISLLMQIKQTQLQQEQQKLQINNAEINLIQIKEQYLSGQVDSGSLDNAVLQKNQTIQTLFNLQTSEQKLISQFKSISDLNYKNAKLPYLKLINEKQFLNNNILVDQQNAQTKQDQYNVNVTRAQYLPTVAVNGGYNWMSSDNQSFGNSGVSYSDSTDYYNYGFSISMPINYNSLRDVESAKVAYLKSQDLIIDQKRASRAIFEQVMENIKNYDLKIKLARESEKLYSNLLGQTQQLYKVGNKTIYDVDTLKNSLNIQKIDVKIYKLSKQQSLLNLYEQFKDDI